MEADIGPDRAAVWMWLLVGMHIKQADGSVSLQAAFLTEDEQSTSSTDLQVMRQKEGDGLADQRAGHRVSLHVTQLQGPGTKLHTDLDPFTTHLFERHSHLNKVKHSG